jgi:hypothetical protein
MGMRVGGGVGPVGGSVGSGGLGLRVGPLSMRTRSRRSRSGLGMGEMIALAFAVLVAYLASPLLLGGYATWVLSRWGTAGRPTLRTLPWHERVMVVAAWVAIPGAVALAVVVWGGTLRNLGS